MSSSRRSQSLDQGLLSKRKYPSIDIDEINSQPKLVFKKYYVDSSQEYALVEPSRRRRINGRIYLRPYRSIKDIYEVFELRAHTLPSSPVLQHLDDIINTPPDKCDRSSSTSSRKRLRKVSEQEVHDQEEPDGWKCSECTFLNSSTNTIIGAKPLPIRNSDSLQSGHRILQRLFGVASDAASKVLTTISEPFKSPPKISTPPTISRTLIDTDSKDENEVRCDRCTYINTPHALVCGACDADLHNTNIADAHDTIALSPVSSVEGEMDEDWQPPKAAPRQTTLKRKFVSPQIKVPVHDLTTTNDVDDIEEFDDAPTSSSHPNLPHYRSVASLNATGDCTVDFKQFELKPEKDYSPSKTKPTAASKGKQSSGRGMRGRGGGRGTKRKNR